MKSSILIESLLNAIVEDVKKSLACEIDVKFQKFEDQLKNLKNDLLHELVDRSEYSNRILTFKEVYSYLRISPSTLQRHIKSGEITGFKSGGYWYFKQSDIDNYINRKIDQTKNKHP